MDTQGLSNEHQVWLRQPATQLLLKALSNYEKRLVDCLVKDLDPTEPSKAHHHGVEIKTTKDIVELITNTETFVARSTQR